MTALVGKYAETVTNITATGSGNWVDCASLAATEFVIGHKYLIRANIDIEGSGGSAEHHARLVHGTTPTEFTDGDSVFDPGAGANGGMQFSWMTVWTQPGTAELIKLQIQGESTNVATCKVSQISTIDLDGLVLNTDYWFNEVTADYTTTATPTAQAAVTLTPNGTDNFWVIGNVSQGVPSVVADGNDFRCELYESVGATTTPLIDIEAEDADAGDEQRNLTIMRTWAALSAAAHTFSLRPYHGGAAFTVLSTRIFVLRLNALLQNAIEYTDGGVSPATSPTFTTVASASFTPSATGNWYYEGAGIQDTFSASSAEMNFRLQDDNDGSAGSDPSIETSMNAPAYDTTDSIPAQFFKLKSLVSAATVVNFQSTEISGTGNIKNRCAVAFSLELAAAAVAIKSKSMGIRQAVNRASTY
jgi:hypothetical protein